MAEESIFQHDGKPKLDTAIDPLLHYGLYEKKLQTIFEAALKVLHKKNHQYGPSWKQRGGVGAFMMLARKWDRIEKAAKENGWDIFVACDRVQVEMNDGLMDDIRDLRNYLTLVEMEMVDAYK